MDDQEVLSLFLPEMDGVEEATSPPQHEKQEEIDPIPFHSVQELPFPDFVELKKKTRMKLTSRRFVRRRKEEMKEHAATIKDLEKDLSQLEAMSQSVDESAHNVSSLHQAATRDVGSAKRELSALERQVLSESSNIREIAQLVQLGQPDASKTVEPSVFSQMKPVLPSQSPQDQLRCALTNFHQVLSAVDTWLAGDTRSLCKVTTFGGWDVFHWMEHGSRYCVLARQTIDGWSRRQLGLRILQEAQNPQRRLSLNSTNDSDSFISRDPPHLPAQAGSLKVASQETNVKPGMVPFDSKEPTEKVLFFTEEVRQHPPPFLPRCLMCVNGAVNDSDRFVFCKQSQSDASCASQTPPSSTIPAFEAVGVLLTDVKTRQVQLDVQVLACLDAYSAAPLSDDRIRSPGDHLATDPPPYEHLLATFDTYLCDAS